MEFMTEAFVEEMSDKWKRRVKIGAGVTGAVVAGGAAGYGLSKAIRAVKLKIIEAKAKKASKQLIAGLERTLEALIKSGAK